MDRIHARLLRQIADASEPIIFKGADARAVAELASDGYIDARIARSGNGAVMSAGVLGIKPRGRDALQERRWRVARWFLRHLDSIAGEVFRALFWMAVGAAAARLLGK